MRQARSKPFDAVMRVGLTLPDVDAATKYDGTPVLKVRGCFMAGLATHPTAEPDTLVVRSSLEEREWLLEDAPETYYLTDYYRPYPLVLARLSRIDRAALRGLLAVSRRLALAKAGPAHGDLKAVVLARRKALSEASRSSGNITAVASRRMRGVSQ